MSVAPGSLAESLGLLSGDRVLAINGHPIRDVLDYQFLCADEEIDLTIERGGIELVHRARLSQSLGIEFAEPTFDGVRRCNNRCLFCFVTQLPGELRSSLYVKDDDFRYSFLYGNFITLTNMTEQDWARLSEQRIGPLHVSVHATESALRRSILGNPRAPDIVSQLERLADIGIPFHAQIVLCPGINDGTALDRTVSDLIGLYPHLRSVGIVPVAVGKSAAARVKGLRAFTPAEAETVIRQIAGYQRGARRDRGATIVHLADEFYLMAQLPFPSARSYDGFVQFENGIGMARVLLDEWSRMRRKVKTASVPSSQRSSVVTGQLAAPVLRRIFGELGESHGWSFDLFTIGNRLFGEHVTVSGLLGGEEVIDELRRASVQNTVYLPRSILDAAGQRTLDGITPEEFEARLGVRVRFASTIKEVLNDCGFREVKTCVA